MRVNNEGNGPAVRTRAAPLVPACPTVGHPPRALRGPETYSREFPKAPFII